MSYRIKTVAEMTGIPRNTILAWERRYQLFSPPRTPGGYRVFGDEDVALLRRLKHLQDQGYKISEAISLLAERTPPPPRPPREQQLRDRLLEHLLRFDRSGADRLRGELNMLSFRDRLDTVFLPLLLEVGEAWAAGQVSVAQEHFVAAFCREQMITMFHSLDAGPEQGPSAVCAGYAGDNHELGLLAVAIKLALAGYRVSYLGANLPLEELIAMLRNHPCRLVCQSIVQVRPARELQAYVTELRRRIDPATLVAVGGPGVGDLAPVEGVLICESVDELLILSRQDLPRA